ncbi:hypothetical protein [uncultured Alteromonas sp.]|uniref:lipase family protein n=1 Tax=uncultured Alteromonas sp. TaxID=179113 RepID=UPI0030EC510D|tara:strand:+ start:11324 stop:12175 length:852 start_codon:yes stop_codon:yes gene_type:complete
MFLSKDDVKKTIHKESKEILSIKSVLGIHGKDALEGYVDEYAALSYNIYNKNDDNDSETFLHNRGWRRCEVDLNTKKGLKAQTWYKILDNDVPVIEVTLVFRGTKSLSDWIWGNLVILLDLFGHAKENSYYRQIQANLDQWLTDIKQWIVKKVNRGGVKFKISATGHSLGGGLAQCACYCTKDISHVFTFNSSWITYYSRLVRNDWEANCKGTYILRFWESGEVLLYLRKLVEVAYLFDTKYDSYNPRYIEYKINLTPWYIPPISSHSIHKIFKGLKTLKEIS